ncbi:NUDIX domain-containing protein [Devosia sp.]|uniref:NUDIX hydrolase n=1 Tax=Devosia sp. TaxID=1871048 RepID=UPI001AD4BD80|nr:NUDIX domain-containing protein [Devosia sp.]MBN9332761.1 NUDIX domain-containing protein [Devosia sp.]
MREIRIAASVIERADGKIALVRKRGTSAFMQPGGKLEPGEAAIDAVVREVKEELGLHLEGPLEPLGRFSATAANEPGSQVFADIFWCRCDEEPVVQAEIEELRWIDPNAPGDLVLAPLTRDHILPALLRRRQG